MGVRTAWDDSQCSQALQVAQRSRQAPFQLVVCEVAAQDGERGRG